MENIENVTITKLEKGNFVKPLLVDFKQDGNARKWEMVKFGNAVFVVIFNKDTKSFVLVKQFRPAVYARKMLERGSENSGELPASEGVTLELCAGLIDKEGKSVAQHAKEEILEETGYDVSLEKIGKWPCNFVDNENFRTYQMLCRRDRNCWYRKHDVLRRSVQCRP